MKDLNEFLSRVGVENRSEDPLCTQRPWCGTRVLVRGLSRVSREEVSTPGEGRSGDGKGHLPGSYLIHCVSPRRGCIREETGEE